MAARISLHGPVCPARKHPDEPTPARSKNHLTCSAAAAAWRMKANCGMSRSPITGPCGARGQAGVGVWRGTLGPGGGRSNVPCGATARASAKHCVKP